MVSDVASGFDAAFSLLLRYEGAMSTDRLDPGNWTGGKVGRGALRGTKYGISAAAFPTLDITSLTQDQAAAIYRHLYWSPLLLDGVPARLAALLFDAAVNSGVAGAVRLLQRALRVVEDGVMGSHTLEALRTQLAAYGQADLCAELLTQRLLLMASLPTWKRYDHGWTRRLFFLAFDTAAMGAAA